MLHLSDSDTLGCGKPADSFRLGFGTPRALPACMTTNEMQTMNEQRIARMMRELQSSLADLVEAGEMTAEQANEWANAKADQWAAEC
jgi:hypothetical protein